MSFVLMDRVSAEEFVVEDLLPPDGPGTVKEGILKGVTMTYVGYGGSGQAGQEEAFVHPFAEHSGAHILSDSPTNYAKIQAQIESGNIVWDVIDSGAADVEANCGILFEPLDYTIIDVSQLPDKTPEMKCGAPALFYGYTFFYNEDKYKDNPPTSWADFFDVEKFPGVRAVDGRSLPTAGTIEAALLADGVSDSDLYPLDLERAFKKWDTVKGDLLYWKTGAEQTQMAESAEADMIFGWSARIYEANTHGANFKPMWKGAFALYDVFAVLKGSKNTLPSMALINYALGAEQQAKMTELTSYSPVNINAKPELDKLGEEFNAMKPEVLEQFATVNIGYWAEHRNAIAEAWDNWLNR